MLRTLFSMKFPKKLKLKAIKTMLYDLLKAKALDSDSVLSKLTQNVGVEKKKSSRNVIVIVADYQSY